MWPNEKEEEEGYLPVFPRENMGIAPQHYP
jgi:hypothetical protein